MALGPCHDLLCRMALDDASWQRTSQTARAKRAFFQAASGLATPHPAAQPPPAPSNPIPFFSPVPVQGHSQFHRRAPPYGGRRCGSLRRQLAIRTIGSGGRGLRASTSAGMPRKVLPCAVLTRTPRSLPTSCTHSALHILQPCESVARPGGLALTACRGRGRAVPLPPGHCRHFQRPSPSARDTG
jgi:hypothetical protein